MAACVSESLRILCRVCLCVAVGDRVSTGAHGKGPVAHSHSVPGIGVLSLLGVDKEEAVGAL